VHEKEKPPFSSRLFFNFSSHTKQNNKEEKILKA